MLRLCVVIIYIKITFFNIRGEIQFFTLVLFYNYTYVNTHAQTGTIDMHWWRGRVRAKWLLVFWHPGAVGVRCHAQGHFGFAQEVTRHLSSYQSTLHIFGPIGTWTSGLSVPKPNWYKLLALKSITNKSLFQTRLSGFVIWREMGLKSRY